MQKIEIDTKELIKLMSKRDNIIGQGSFGIVIPYQQEVIKIYYKKIFAGFYYLDEKKLISEIETNKQVEQEMVKDFLDYKDSLIRDLKKLEILEAIGLVKGRVYCNQYMIGILLNYYRDYVNVLNIYSKLSIKNKKIVLKKIESYLHFLIANNIYPDDVKANNILVRKSDFDVKFIDLDDQETRYESKNYVKEFPYIESNCIEKFKVMCKRLNK